MLVMGGYGHPRFRQMILGGVTRHMLEHMTVPVMFSR
jgi:nucleotide-binding universal stress UspA family protein